MIEFRRFLYEVRILNLIYNKKLLLYDFIFLVDRNCEKNSYKKVNFVSRKLELRELDELNI